MIQLRGILCLLGILSLPASQGLCNIQDHIEPANPENTYALIIANEAYQYTIDSFTTDVLHAIRDAELFRQQLIRNYGIPKKNISFHCNTNAIQLKLAITKIAKQASGGDTEIIIYYNGKFQGSSTQGKLYFLPSKTQHDNTLQAVNISYFYTKLAGTRARKITILLDAEKYNTVKQAGLLRGNSTTFPVDHSTLTDNTRIFIAVQEPIQYYALDAAPGKQQDVAPGIPKKETNAPSLQLFSHSIEEINRSSSESILIRGQAYDDSGVYMIAINGQEAHAAADGSFKARIALKAGMNVVVMQVIDIHQNTLKKEIRIELVPEPVQRLSSNIIEGELGLKYHALLIGVNTYEDPLLNNLNGPLQDIQKLHEVLSTFYSFATQNIHVLRNPTRQQIIEILDQLERELGDQDNLLVFYAGHGTWDNRVRKGYWLPADARLDNTANWIRNTTISGYISGIASKHTLLISDACFSGGIFKTRSFDDASWLPGSDTENRSRKAMTSGALQEVPDQSVFTRLLIENLQQNTQAQLRAEQLFYSCKSAVVESGTTIPQYGIIKNTGDEGGDFVFIRSIKP